jgi:hypothetical protein
VPLLFEDLDLDAPPSERFDSRQRSEFAAVIERQDLDGLLAELRARAGSRSS